MDVPQCHLVAINTLDDYIFASNGKLQPPARPAPGASTPAKLLPQQLKVFLPGFVPSPGPSPGAKPADPPDTSASAVPMVAAAATVKQQRTTPAPTVVGGGEIQPYGSGAAATDSIVSGGGGGCIPPAAYWRGLEHADAAISAAGGSVSGGDSDGCGSQRPRGPGEPSCSPDKGCPSPSSSVPLSLSRKRFLGLGRLGGLSGLGSALDGLRSGSVRLSREGGSDVAQRLLAERERCMRLSVEAGRRLERECREARARAAAQMRAGPT